MIFIPNCVILNQCLTTSITFHNILHGFWAGRGTGTASLEAKLTQKLMTIMEEILYAMFLDLNTAHDALYRYICLGILEG